MGVERGKLIADRYELTGRLGRGGMGEVWAARDRVLHREVALKLLDLDGIAHADLPRRFEREAVAAAQIVHPNVAALYDRGIHDDVLFLVMEKVDGQTLTARLRAESPFPLTRALAVASGVCAALEAAHRAQVIHYDIKPHNVILTGDGLVKVIDFGIAGFVQAAFTVARSSQLAPAGTPEFGAPEQFRTERGDERSDLYALGGMLFAMLAGRPPFTGHNSIAVVRRKLDEEAPPLDAFRSGLPPEVTTLVAELLARDPDRRPQSARLVQQRLQALLASCAVADAPTAAVPPTPPTRPLDDVTRRVPRPPSPGSWNRASTDETPFTPDALLPRRFTNDLGIEFARIAADTRPSREAGPSDLVRELARRDCTEVVAGVYAEQPGSHATPEHPVHISVQVFAFPDVATAQDAHGYLGDGGGAWHLTIWGASAEGGLTPGPDKVRRSRRWKQTWRKHRYLAVALAYRADLTNDGSITPWLAAAARRAATSTGPRNHHGA
ncbi:serine/threonine-protein kinase [Streptomyces sp. DSM 44915]|uniref:non-specific serine/threonine protein kinase n=1 Tax=Streptomyces chisholmiae TaxID=3075540 RepID=A0ABU2JWP2_9ACTN|nr:serine/threonine-protein kinase [Streptomyces sp. DSM 44915]MDT0268643.1 serine/threonine-protein kinase [Streptomyces sp. DSM 44915]